MPVAVASLLLGQLHHKPIECEVVVANLIFAIKRFPSHEATPGKVTNFQGSVLTKINRYPKNNINATNKINFIARFHDGIPLAPLSSRQPVFST